MTTCLQQSITPLPLFAAIAKGREQAQACTEKTRQTASDWPESAALALRGYIRRCRLLGVDLFTAEAARESCYEARLTRPHDDRAWGSIFTQAAREGLIRKSQQTYQRTRGHGSPAFYWEIVKA